MPYDQDWYAGQAFKGPFNSFEIETDQDAVVLRGARDEATDQVLTGKVIMKLKSVIAGSVRLQLHRRLRHTPWRPVAGDPLGQAGPVDVVFNEKLLWTDMLVPEKTKFGPGEHFWNFSIPIDADTASSLEGPTSTYVVYRLTAIVERGVLQKNFVQKKHVRIHRTFNPDALTLQQTMLTESCWEGKCAYFIQTPTKGVIYGTHLPMEYKLAPLAKGIRIHQVKCTIQQVIRYHKATYSRLPDSYKVSDIERDVSESVVLVDQNLAQDVESFFTVSQNVPLPKDLVKCCQTYKENVVPDIEVKHYASYKVTIWNPDGHLSEIQGRLPIHIFFTSTMQVEGTRVTGLPEVSADPMSAALSDIPPDYAHSHLDQLYGNVSTSGFATPGHHSGTMTPRSYSYTGMDMLQEDDDESADPEASANAMRNRSDNEINPVSAASSPTNEPSANALRQRLEEIRLDAGSSRSQSNTNSLARNRSFQGTMGYSPNNGATPLLERENPVERTPPVRQNSGYLDSAGSPHSTSPGHSGAVTPFLRSALPTRPSSPVQLEDLNKVPSYTTAMSTPAPTGAYGSQHGGDGLPTYLEVEESTSRNGSVTGSGAGSGAVTPATAASSIGSSEARPGFLSEQSRSRSGLFSSFLHKNK